MNTSYLFHLALLVAGLLAFTSCENDDPAPDPLSLLPPATQSGAETWGAIINGEAAYSTSGYYSRIERRSASDMTLYLGTKEDKWGTVTFTISEAKLVEDSTYLLKPILAMSGEYTNPNDNPCLYYYEHLLDGYLTITKFDPAIDKVIAGTFAFTSAKEGCDTLRVRNGRFDIITSY
ncbi:MAG: hypothetical protein WBB45_07635 [Cyclobacteriaceae bacterium]